MAVLTTTDKEQHETLAAAAAQPGFSLPLIERALESLRGTTGSICRWLDPMLLAGTFFGVVALHYSLSAELTPADVLRMRVSVRSLLIGAICIIAWRGILHAVGLYHPIRIRTLTEYLLRCAAGVAGCSLLVAMVVAVFEPGVRVGSVTTAYWAICILLMLTARVLLLSFDRSIRPRLRTNRSLLIVGTGMRAVDVYREMKANQDVNYSLLGYIDSEPQIGHVSADQVLGSIGELENILMRNVVDEVVIALPMRSQYDTIGEIIATCERLGVQSQYFTHHFGTRITKGRRSTGSHDGRMILEAVHIDDRLHLKRIVDFVGAFFGLLFLSPLLVATAIAVKLSSPGPIIYKQQRFGLNKRIFSMLKFRSMVINAEALQAKLEHLNETSGPAFKIANDPRVTPIGQFLRKMSIDELPQLFNVLMGDMSLVGPRPLPTRDVSRFSEAWLMRRFSVKPGLTCLWQVTGRSDIDFDRWIELDLEYIDRWSLTLDLEILFKTIPAVLKGKGAS